MVEVVVATWCLNVLKEVSSFRKNEKFVRKFRGSNFVVMALKYDNKRGSFLKYITTLSNGSIRNTIVPRGQFG